MSVSDNVGYYQILGLLNPDGKPNRDVTEEEVKKAYKKMAMKWHPDKNRGKEEEANKKMAEISEAKDILSDKRKKELYDKIGKEKMKMYENMAGSMGADPEMAAAAAAWGVMFILFLLVTLSMAALFALLLVVNVDKIASGQPPWSWVAVFAPVWVFDSVLFLVACSLYGAPKERRLLTWDGFLQVCLFIAFHILLVMKLDGSGQLTYIQVFLPAMILEVLGLPSAIATCKKDFYDKVKETLPMSYPVFVLTQLTWFFCHFGLVFLLAFKLSATFGVESWSWAKLFIPCWTFYGWSLARDIYSLARVGSDPSDTQKQYRVVLQLKIFFYCCTIALLCALVAKLSGATIPTFIMFLPIFIFFGLLCCGCCMCCCCMGLASGAQDGEDSPLMSEKADQRV